MRASAFLAIAAAAITLAAMPARADTVEITAVTDMSEPSGTITSSNTMSFTGTEKIMFKVMGKTCTWVGSAAGSVPKGCNYGLTVNMSTGKLSDPTSLDNPVCTQTSDMLANCK
ncbi:hypothetical protein [Roseospira visakhapatnamensis]|uniref:Uncharacterized protein n=1 Tax=Roseospira visakhapatnamensis TaxID=390880 RepID=A0A7W6RCR9_9PROT|nr:hypothetical protein [Roseospira visakhapatnamensis]MBB4265604.1 hypothetical protein [Roseospira visakhapatnamensis]